MSDFTRPEQPDELLDLLRAINPVPDESILDTPAQRARDEVLLQRILDGSSSAGFIVLASTRQRRRRRVAVVVLAVAALSAAAFAWAVTRHASNPLGIGCYSAFEVDADRTGVSPDGRDPLELCAEAWQMGRVTGHATDAPPLVGCTTNAGSIAVLPSPTGRSCGELGWVDLAKGDPNDRPGAASLAAFQQELIDRFLGATCPSLEEGRTIAEDVLADHGFHDWFVTAPPAPAPDRPCASVSIDPASKSVLLVPLPQPSND